AMIVLAALERIVAPRRVALTEVEDGDLALTSQPHRTTPNGADPRFRIVAGADKTELSTAAARLKGSRVEVFLTTSKILLRPIELPGRASEFLDGIIRAQIDRLTPWAARDAAFGSSSPRAVGNDRIALTIAATARSTVMPYVNAVAGHGARSIS